MANVIYTPKESGETFDNLIEGTYFDYKDTLFLLVDEQRGIVFDFVDGTSFAWCDEFDGDVPVKVISSNRVTIKVD